MSAGSQAGSAVESGEPLVWRTGRRRRTVLMAISIITTVTLTTVYTVISPFGWAGCVAVASGVVAGIELVAFPRALIEVHPDRVRLVNMFRIIVVRKSAIAGLRTNGGIRILLCNGKWLIPTAFPPNTYKLVLSKPQRDREFGKAMAAMLGVGPDIPYLNWDQKESLPEDSITYTWRGEVFGAAAVGAVSMFLLALVILVLSRNL